MLVEYERIDAPKSKRERIAWSMYVSHKIVDYLGNRELTLLHNLPLESLNNQHTLNIYSIVANMLCR